MKSETFKNVVIMSVVAFVLALMLGVGIIAGKNGARIDAVKAGHARWVPDETGRTTFEWLRETPCKPAPATKKE